MPKSKVEDLKKPVNVAIVWHPALVGHWPNTPDFVSVDLTHEEEKLFSKRHLSGGDKMLVFLPENQIARNDDAQVFLRVGAVYDEKPLEDLLSSVADAAWKAGFERATEICEQKTESVK